MESQTLDIKSALADLAFGCSCDSKRHVRRISSREVGDASLELWHAIDISDFSTFRSFVICPGKAEAYDIDFLSRHEIMPPMTLEKLPEGWQNWAIIKKNQMLVTDREAFCRQMMTPDSFVALPTYRFDFFADDVMAVCSESKPFCSDASEAALDAMEDVLRSPLTGYAHKIYYLARYGTSQNIDEPVVEFSWTDIEGGRDDQDSDNSRLASE